MTIRYLTLVTYINNSALLFSQVKYKNIKILFLEKPMPKKLCFYLFFVYHKFKILCLSKCLIYDGGMKNSQDISLYAT